MVRRSVARALRELDLSGRHLLVAASGGVDSTVLAHVLQTLSGRFELELTLGHVNHGLRGEASRADEDAVRALAARLGRGFVAAPADPRPGRSDPPSRTRPTLQEAARRTRYAALRRMARRVGAEHVATAHTADDQAETVLLRLLRGSGPGGLGGIPERSPDGLVVRPLLAVPRAEVLAWAREQGLSWREDASNASPAYTRNRLRRTWLPSLAREFNPRLSRALCDLAEAQRRESEWIEMHVDEWARRCLRREGDGIAIRTSAFAALPEALARRLARRALVLAGEGRDVSRAHVTRVVAFLRNPAPAKRVELPGRLLLTCEGDTCRLATTRVSAC